MTFLARTRHVLRRPALLYGVLAVAVYGASLGNGFALDDEAQILLNQMAQDLSNFLRFFGSSTMQNGGSQQAVGGIYYKPVMMTLYSLLWSIWGANALPFHAVQLALHTTNALLLRRFLLVFFAEPVALVLGLIFLVHPMNTEVVAYIADMQDALFLFFGLAALNLCATRAAPGPARLLLTLACLCLSVLSKETGVLFLLICPLFAWQFRRERLMQILGICALAATIYATLRIGLAKLTVLTDTSVTVLARSPLSIRLLSMPKVLFHYFASFAFPAQPVVTQDWAVTSMGFVDFWAPLLALLAIFGLLIWHVRRSPEEAPRFFLAWLFVGLALHSQIIPLDGTVADRWLYFPMIGMLGLAAGATPWLVSRNRALSRAAMPAILLIIIAGLSARSFARSLDWKDTYTISVHDLTIDPTLYYLENNVGVELYRRGQVAAALPHFKRSTELAPHWTTNWNNLGAAHEELGNIPEAEACFRKSIDNGVYYLAFRGYVRILTRTGRIQEAMDFLDRIALRAFPGDPTLSEARRSLAGVQGQSR